MTPRKKPEQSEVPTQPNDIVYWMGRVDGALNEFRSLFKQYVVTNEQNWTDERGWRTVVNNALADLNSRLSVLEGKITMLSQPKEPEKDPDDKHDDETDIEKTAVTWKWLVEKLAVPVITAVIIFLMLQFFPNIFAHLAAAK
jgi:hypothetical protein